MWDASRSYTATRTRDGAVCVMDSEAREDHLIVRRRLKAAVAQDCTYAMRPVPMRRARSVVEDSHRQATRLVTPNASSTGGIPDWRRRHQSTPHGHWDTAGLCGAGEEHEWWHSKGRIGDGIFIVARVEEVAERQRHL